MKKSYIKPETLEVKFEAQGVIAASSLRIMEEHDPVDTSVEGTQLTNKNGWSSSNWY